MRTHSQAAAQMMPEIIRHRHQAQNSTFEGWPMPQKNFQGLPTARPPPAAPGPAPGPYSTRLHGALVAAASTRQPIALRHWALRARPGSVPGVRAPDGSFSADVFWLPCVFVRPLGGIFCHDVATRLVYMRMTRHCAGLVPAFVAKNT